MILDGKTSVAKKTLQELIKMEALKHNKNLQKEINILKKKVNTSNVKRSKASSATKNCHQNKRKKAKEKRETETKPMHLTMILS
jgi:hypothetical protein